MARPSKPWYRASKDSWYVTVNGKKLSLGVRGQENMLAAITAWDRLMAGLDPRSRGEEANGKTEREKKESDGGPTVRDVFTGFLADCQGRVKTNTLRGYRDFLDPFQLAHGKKLAKDLTPTVAEGYSRKSEWSPSTRHD